MKAGWLETLAGDSRLSEIRENLGSLQAVSGLQGASRLLIPLLATEKPLLFVVPHEREVEPVAEDLQTLAREAGLEGTIAALPAPGPPPFRGLPRHAEASWRRAIALRGAGLRTARAWVSSPLGLSRPVLHPSYFKARVFALKAGEESSPEIFLELLDEAGYRREDPVISPGQMARRGGILDVFPPERELPVRIEFIGDTIESLRPFRVDTQRSAGHLESLEIFPLTDLFPTRALLDELARVLEERFRGQRGLGGLLKGLERGSLGSDFEDLLCLVPGGTVPPWVYLEQSVAVSLDPELISSETEAFHVRAREHRQRRGDELLPEPEEVLVGIGALETRRRTPPALEMREVDPEGRGRHIPSRPVRRYAGNLKALTADLKQGAGRTVLFLGTAGRAGRLKDVLAEEGIGKGVEVRVGALRSGFELPDVGLRILSDGDIFPEEVHLHHRHRGVRTFLSDFRDLRIGALVVHEQHGIGRFEGLETLEVGGVSMEFMVLSYAGGDKLKVPIDAFDQVERYQGAEGTRPKLDALGSGGFEKVKRRVKKAMREMAAELLQLYARRKTRPGHAFSAEGPWQSEFEEAFDFEETPDQEAAIRDVSSDMVSETPMDRLICGDVGYGKTEVAMRAAMRAVLDSKQVALLAPTTILAFQHEKTFKRRFAPFPVRIEMVSRLRSPGEIRAALKALAEGSVDIVIGTHRILSKDVVFRDLGLLVVDEEQRFGVSAKERLKHLKASVDCLTLSATPIPRTLQMALTGIRDMSVIETPPKDRLAIQTSTVTFATETIAAAIRQEIARDGQVYFVHNRVESIYALAALVQRLCPEVRVGVAHGQMKEKELERIMIAFVEGRIDVLVSTTIVENGLDIPRVNTILINRADRYGLSQLYQLRGRVGRSDRRAYAYLLVPPQTVLSEIAQKRLSAIQEFSELGAGFRIAALDLELRGAGNLLGGEQSGHIEAVGLDLYLKLLEQAVHDLRGEGESARVRASLNIRADLRIPTDYVPDTHQRMALYKRLTEIKDGSEVESLRGEIRDRFGPPPRNVEDLLTFAVLRRRAEDLGIQQVDYASDAYHVRFTQERSPNPDGVVALLGSIKGSRLSPSGVLHVPWAPGLEGLEALLSRMAAL